MTTHYRSSGLILAKRDFRETDRFFTVFTKDFGKIEALAKGERKIKSKLRGGLELFYLSEIEFIQGRHWKTLIDASLIDNFSGLRAGLEKLLLAYRVADVSDGLVSGQQRDSDIWNLLTGTFSRLDNQADSLVYQYFFWRLVSHLGYQPKLYECASCHKSLNPRRLYFDAEQGGLICNDCEGRTQPTDAETVKVLRLILENDWKTLSQVAVDKSHRRDLSNLSEYYFSHLENL